jgi:hypothetical protein
MSDVHKQEAHATVTPVATHVLSRIAGPETARLLGVPIGSVVETRDISMTPTEAPNQEQEA